MYVRKGNLEYFYKIRIFRPIAFKAIIYPLFDLSFWLFTNSPFKKFRRPEKKFSWDGLIFSDLIFVCVNKKKWLQPSLTDFERVQIFFTGMVLFPLVSGYSLILRWKNSGDQKKCPYEVDSFFLTWYIYVLTKKMTAAISDWFWACTNFFNGLGTFFRIFLGGMKIWRRKKSLE